MLLLPSLLATANVDLSHVNIYLPSIAFDQMDGLRCIESLQLGKNEIVNCRHHRRSSELSEITMPRLPSYCARCSWILGGKTICSGRVTIILDLLGRLLSVLFLASPVISLQPVTAALRVCLRQYRIRPFTQAEGYETRCISCEYQLKFRAAIITTDFLLDIKHSIMTLELSSLAHCCRHSNIPPSCHT